MIHVPSAAKSLERKLEKMVLEEIQKPWYVIRMKENAEVYVRKVLELYKESNLKRIANKEEWTLELTTSILAKIAYALYTIEKKEKKI